MTANYCDECGDWLGTNYEWGGPCDYCVRQARQCVVCGDADCQVDHAAEHEEMMSTQLESAAEEEPK